MRFLGLLVVTAMLVTGCAGMPKVTVSEVVPPAPIRIGQLAVLQAEKNAIVLLVERLNREGGVLGRPLQVVARDVGVDTGDAVKQARQLIEQDKVVAIIGPAYGSIAVAIAPVCERARVPFIATTAAHPEVTLTSGGELRQYAFRACYSDPFQGTVAAQFALTRLDAANAAVLYDMGSEYSSSMCHSFIKAFEKGGGEIEMKEAFRTGELDYRASLAAIIQRRPDVIFLPIPHREAAAAMKQARDMGFGGAFLGCDAWGNPDIITLGGRAAEGAYFVSMASADDPGIAALVKEYVGKFGAEPVMPDVAMAVDSLLMLVDAISRAKATEGPALVKALEATRDLTAPTGRLTVDPATHELLNRPAVIRQIRGGELVFVERFVTK